MTSDADAPAATGASGIPAPPGTASTRAAVVDRWVIAGEIAVAAFVVLWRLGAKSFWLDEAFTWSSVHRSWPAFVHHVTTTEAGGAGYLAFMWLWSHVSDAEWFLRLPSALCALPLVPAVVLTGRRLFDRRVALVAGLLVAIDVDVVVYGQEARTYLLTMLLGTVCVYGFVGEMTSPSRRSLWTWVVPGGLLVYTQPAGIGVLAAQAVSLLFAPRERMHRERRARLARGATVIAVVSAPMLVLLAATRGDRTHFLEGGRSLSEIVHAIASIAATGARELVVVVFALALYAATRAWVEWRRPRRSMRAWSHAFLWCWLVVPTVLTILASFVEDSFQSRYLVQVVPALVLLVAVALCALRPVWVGAVAFAVVVALSGAALAGYYGRPKDDWRDATPWLLAHARPGDGVVFLGDEARIPFEYYLHRDGGDAHGLVPLYPAQPWTRFRTGEEHQTFPTASEVRAWARADRRVWTITARGGSWPAGQDEAAARRSVARLRPGRRPVEHRMFAPGVDVVLYAPAPRNR